MRAKFKNPLRHEEIKSPDRIPKKSGTRTLINFDAYNEVTQFCSNVSLFKELIDSGPYYICVVYNHFLHRRSAAFLTEISFV